MLYIFVSKKFPPKPSEIEVLENCGFINNEFLKKLRVRKDF
jgi:hypothetical protein